MIQSEQRRNRAECQAGRHHQRVVKPLVAEVIEWSYWPLGGVKRTPPLCPRIQHRSRAINWRSTAVSHFLMERVCPASKYCDEVEVEFDIAGGLPYHRNCDARVFDDCDSCVSQPGCGAEH